MRIWIGLACSLAACGDVEVERGGDASFDAGAMQPPQVMFADARADASEPRDARPDARRDAAPSSDASTSDEPDAAIEAPPDAANDASPEVDGDVEIDSDVEIDEEPAILAACGGALPAPRVDSEAAIELRTIGSELGGGAHRFATADLDADGDADLVVMNQAGAVSASRWNDGAYGVFSPLGELATSPSSLTSISAGDFDGDGFEDVYFERGILAGEVWFSDGALGVAAILPLAGELGVRVFGKPVAIADFDGDDADEILFTGTTSAGPVPFYLELGGRAATFTTVPELGALTEHTVVAQLDRRDDAPDLFVVGAVGTTYRNDGAGHFAVETVFDRAFDRPAYFRLYSAAMFDVDGDCRAESITVNSSFSPQDSLCVRRGPRYDRGLLRLGASTSDCFDIGTSSGFAQGDLDGDGDDDLLTQTHQYAFIARGGVLEFADSIFAPGAGPSATYPGSLPRFSLVDVDQDGDADLFALVAPYYSGSAPALAYHDVHALLFFENLTR